MTGSEILKAKAYLEYGINCDIFQEPVMSYAKAALWAFEEINRQKAEIQKLEKEVDRLSQVVMYHDGHIADAINDFAKMLIDKSKKGVLYAMDIPDYAKEMKEQLGAGETREENEE